MRSPPGAPVTRTRSWWARAKRPMQTAARPSAFVRLPHGGMPVWTAPSGETAGGASRIGEPPPRPQFPIRKRAARVPRSLSTTVSL